MNQALSAQVFIALGSNVDATQRMQRAADLLKQSFRDVRFSRSYRNRAFGFEGDDFINAVAGFSTPLTIPELLPILHSIEASCGRARDAAKWAPRAMDLDLLLYADQVGSGPGYTVPRPDLLKRVYMLGPLAQLAPGLRYPPAGPTIGELWAQFPHSDDALIPLDLDLNAG